jgi:hypothetical protein
VGQLTGDLQADFACPSAPARIVFGDWLTFERGVMVSLAADPLVYVYYEDGTWEQVAPSDAGDSEAGSSQPEGIANIPLPFSSVLAAEGRHLLLGEALNDAPVGENSVVQPFLGGVAVGSQDSGRILFLARSKLRF